MKTLEQFLEEGRDAPLYHATNIGAFIDILKLNRLEGKTIHSARGIRPNLKHKHQQQHDNGVSLTRNFEFAMKWGSVIFVLDQRKLAQKHKLVPLDWAYEFDSEAMRGEMEEFVIGDINNLNRYLIGVNVLVNKEGLKYRDYRGNIQQILRLLEKKKLLNLFNNETIPRMYRKLSISRGEFIPLKELEEIVHSYET